MSDPRRKLDPTEAAASLDGWQADGDTLRVRFRTGDFVTGLNLVNRIGEAAERRQHHPDLTLTYPEVTVCLTSHDVGGVTSRDLDLAAEITAIAAGLGIETHDH